MRWLAIHSVIILLFASPASAQWSAAAFLGNAWTSPSRFDIRSPDHDAAVSIESVKLADESSRSPWYYGARVTRRFARARWLGVEAEFIHAKTISDPAQVVSIRGRVDGAPVDGQQPLGTILPRFELSHGLNFLLGNAVLRWGAIGRDRDDAVVAIVGRVGLGPTIPHVEGTFRGENEDAYQSGRIGVGAAIGAEVRLSRYLGAIAEFKITHTDERVHVGSADIESGLTTRHVVAGVMWRINGT
jgi:hypothetical protein